MKTLLLSLLLLAPSAVPAKEKFLAPEPLLTKADESRRPASLVRSETLVPAATNEEIFRNIQIGSKFQIQNSLDGWNDEVVTVIAIYDDQSVRVKFRNGNTPLVQFKNLARNLAPEIPETNCGESQGTSICKGDKVLYRSDSASLLIPEAEVMRIFANGSATLRDGFDFELPLSQVGKSVDCSPQKPGYCVGDSVLAEGFRDGARHVFEGRIERAYSHGPVLVRVDTTLLIPIDVSAVKKRVAAEASIDDPNVVTDFGMKETPTWTVLPEIEPLDPIKADRVNKSR